MWAFPASSKLTICFSPSLPPSASFPDTMLKRPYPIWHAIKKLYPHAVHCKYLRLRSSLATYSPSPSGFSFFSLPSLAYQYSLHISPSPTSLTGRGRQDEIVTIEMPGT